MTDGRKEIKAFVGFQTKSEFHTFEEFEAMLASLRDELREKHNIALRARYGIFPPGGILWNEVEDAIYECDVAVFDISENNANVMIEVGLAYGFGRQVFLLKNRQSFSSYRLPSDLAVVYVPYAHGMLNSDEVINALVSGITSFLDRPHRFDYFFRSLWGFSEHDAVLIVCSELDEPEKRQHPEPNEYIYLSKYGDVDSLLEVLVTMHRLYPRLDVKFRSANEVRAVPEEYTGNIILVGGPDYNTITRLFEEYSPFEYVRGGREEDILIRRKGEDAVLVPRLSTEAGESRIVDYGFYVKQRNPYNPAKRLIMLGGAHTYGVFGAAKAFSFWGGLKDEVAHLNCKSVVDSLGHDPNFAALFEVHAIDSTVITPKLDPSGLIAITP